MIKPRKPITPEKATAAAVVSEATTMMAIFTRDKRCIGWSGREWAEKLGVSKSTVTGTSAWKAIMKEREDQKKALQKGGYVK